MAHGPRALKGVGHAAREFRGKFRSRAVRWRFVWRFRRVDGVNIGVDEDGPFLMQFHSAVIHVFVGHHQQIKTEDTHRVCRFSLWI